MSRRLLQQTSSRSKWLNKEEYTVATIGDVMKSKSKDIEVLKDEIGIFKNLIKERKHPLDLVRELLSNAGAREVGATEIEISYTKDREGHIFEIVDNGCGMNFTGRQDLPGRLDRFLGLGMSAIAGTDSDEFSWKGLGSKLAYQSRKVEIETRFEGHSEYSVVINEPWDTLNRKSLPRPRISEYADSDRNTGTRIRVTGHPPHRQEKPFSLEEIRSYLQHRTFAGFTKQRQNMPKITLSVLGNVETLPFGFPEFRGIDWPKGVLFDREQNRLLVHIIQDWPMLGHVILKGFLTWEGSKYRLDKDGLNTGLILSTRGIPYFELDMEHYGARSILRGYPGKGNICLVAECDRLSAEMNISRSDLVDSAETLEFRKAVHKLLDTLETSADYLEKFRQIPQKKKQRESADHLTEQKRLIESEDQNWVILQREGQFPLLLMREPKNESEVNAIIWKLEALQALPFHRFQTLGYVGAQKGPDLLVNFQEDSDSEPLRAAVVEVENNFYSYKAHGHLPTQYPKVICWDNPTSGRKDRLKSTAKKYKFTISRDDYQVHVYVLKLMDGIRVVTKREMASMGLHF
jgi:hypothetical protein